VQIAAIGSGLPLTAGIDTMLLFGDGPIPRPGTQTQDEIVGSKDSSTTV